MGAEPSGGLTNQGSHCLPEDPDHPDPDKFYGCVFQDTDFSKWVEAVGLPPGASSGCACCPPNLARLVESVRDYAYALAEDGSSLFVHLYIGGSIQADLGEGSIALRVHSALPWKGRIRLKAEASGNGRTTLAFRLLSCAGGDAATDAVTVHTGQGSSDDISRRVEQGYLYLSGPWKKGDRIDTDFDMPVRAVAAYPLVSLDANKVAVTRGP